MGKIMNEGQGQIFKNPMLEALTKVSFGLAFTVYPIIALSLLSLNIWFGYVPVLLIISAFFGGILFWTFFEYVVHRYVFHIVGESPRTKRFRYVAHGIHHDYPRDAERLIMPPAPWAIIVSALFGLFYLIMGPLAFSFAPGFIIGHLLYVYVHYKIHTDNPPKVLQKQLKHHALHHYKYPNKAFGVSTPLWDLIFGTMPPKGAIAKEH